MVEKIIVNPNEIRGYGNILNVHSSSDYDLEDCTIATGTDTVNGATETVYTLTPTFTPPPTPTYLFYDDCSSSSGLSNYGTLHHIGNQTSGGTLSYDSTKNAYKFSPSNAASTGFCDIPIPTLDNLNNYYIQCEIYTDDTGTSGQSGLAVYPSNDTGGNAVTFRDIANINRCGVLKFTSYSENGESGNSQQSSLPVGGNWYRVRLEVSGTSVKGIWLKTDGTQVYTHTYTVPYTSSTMRVGIMFLSSNTSKYYYVRNIEAASLSPSPTPTPTGYSLAFSQSTYEDPLGLGVNIYATLKDNGTAMSGETVTFSWTSLGVPTSQTAVTNSSGVATIEVYGDLDDYVVTASYQTASATCTISGGGIIID